MNATEQIAASGNSSGNSKFWGPEAGSPLQVAGAQDIAASEWPAFCDWFGARFKGLATSIERHESGEDLEAVCHDLPLFNFRAHQLENGVPALSIAVLGKPGNILLDITGPKRMVLHWNAAGWPTQLEIGYDTGEVIAQFAGELEPARGATRNSWGE